MTKYIEEMQNGDCFAIDDAYYVLTNDFRKNGQRLAISVKDGFSRWFDGSKMVEDAQLYIMDKDNNIIPIKPTKKTDVSTQT